MQMEVLGKLASLNHFTRSSLAIGLQDLIGRPSATFRKKGVFMRIQLSTALLVTIISLSASSTWPPALAEIFDDILVSPKTLIDRAIEARSSSNKYKDNKIVVKVNAMMADLGTIKASTEIYEQRLLITGLFEHTQVYDEFLTRVEAVDGINERY